MEPGRSAGGAAGSAPPAGLLTWIPSQSFRSGTVEVSPSRSGHSQEVVTSQAVHQKEPNPQDSKDSFASQLSAWMNLCRKQKVVTFAPVLIQGCHTGALSYTSGLIICLSISLSPPLPPAPPPLLWTCCDDFTLNIDASHRHGGIVF